MADMNEALTSLDRNIEARTGRPFADWVALLRARGLEKHGQMVAWLKAEHGLSHGDANRLSNRAIEAAAPRSADDPIAHLFEGGKEELRPLYDDLVTAALSLGSDVEIAPKKANASVRRRKQFALIQPTTRTRMDLGLILANRAVHGRLEPSGSFNAMFTHRVKLVSIGDVDAEVRGWLKEAYDGAG